MKHLTSYLENQFIIEPAVMKNEEANLFFAECELDDFRDNNHESDTYLDRF